MQVEKRFVAALGFFVAVQIAPITQSQATPYLSTSDLLKDCQKLDEPVSENEKFNSLNAGVCYGYVAGIADVMASNCKLSRQTALTQSVRTMLRQSGIEPTEPIKFYGYRTVVDYIERTPESLEYEPHRVVENALRAASPCQTPN